MQSDRIWEVSAWRLGEQCGSCLLKPLSSRVTWGCELKGCGEPVRSLVMKLIPARYTRIVEVCMEREEWLWLM